MCSVFCVCSSLSFQKSLSPLFLFSKLILQMPIQQKAQSTKELKLSEATLEELYHLCGRWSSLFVGFSDLFQVKTLCQRVLSLFLTFFFPLKLLQWWFYELWRTLKPENGIFMVRLIFEGSKVKFSYLCYFRRTFRHMNTNDAEICNCSLKYIVFSMKQKSTASLTSILVILSW